MSIIGKIVIGLTDLVASNLPYISGPYISGEDGTVDSVSVYTETTGVNLRLAVYVYDEATARPTTLIASSDLVTITEAGWQTLARTSGTGAIEQGKSYWIGFYSAGVITYKLNQQEEKWQWNTSMTGTSWRNPFLTGGGSTLYRAISAYFTYTPAVHDPEDTSLQARINRAAPGSTVKIPYGFYNERLNINKSLHLMGVPDRRGRIPIIQGGNLVTWTASAEPEHSGKNVWYTDISINGSPAVWIRSVQLGNRGVQILQYHPFLAGEGVNQATATTVREHVLECDWSSPGFYLGANTTTTIDFWQWYDAIACHDATGRLWLRLKNNVNPNNFACYVTATLNTRSTDVTDRNYTNDRATVISCSSQSDITISNLEIRGGRWGIDIQNSSNILIEKNKVLVPSLRGINITDCSGVVIQGNEFTSNWMRTNIGPGFGGASDRAKAMAFGWDLNKNYSTSGEPAPSGHSIDLNGMTENVIIRRNKMYNQGGGVGWGRGSDPWVVDAVIENNRFETMESAGIVVYTKADGVAQFNEFWEVHLNFRIQSMSATAYLGTLVTIANNDIRSFEQAGYVMQAHYDTSTVWSSPINFENNFVQNVAIVIANLLGFADVIMRDNVIDTAQGYSSALATNGMDTFENNWVGGDAENIKNLVWFDPSNEYTEGQRLVNQELPLGYEEVGPYRQNIGLPIRKRLTLDIDMASGLRTLYSNFGRG